MGSIAFRCHVWDVYGTSSRAVEHNVLCVPESLLPVVAIATVAIHRTTLRYYCLPSRSKSYLFSFVAVSPFRSASVFNFPPALPPLPKKEIRARTFLSVNPCLERQYASSSSFSLLSLNFFFLFFFNQCNFLY